MESLSWLVHSHVVHGAFTAFLVAFFVDLHAWKSWEDCAFNFKIASFRWITAAIFGAGMAVGIS